MKALNDDLQMRSDWLFPICAGRERLKDDDGRKAHPTQKPEALLHRVLLASTSPGDVVLDPFFGTGTTGAVAKRLGRHFIGIERDPDLRRRRRGAHRQGAAAAAERAGDHQVASAPSRACRSAPSSSSAFCEPGAALTDERGRIRAEVKADGTLAVGGRQGSIHRLGAQVQGKTACNGWTYWHFEVEGQRKPIDALRDVAKRQLGLTPAIGALVAAE